VAIVGGVRFDLGRLRLSAGEGRRLDLAVPLPPLEFGGESYAPAPAPVPVRIDVSRTTGEGYALRARFAVAVEGPCMRCLEPAAPRVEVDAREVSQPGAGDELSSPYVREGQLDVDAWARDALALALPARILCRPECAGLCPECGVDLNEAGPGHGHARPPDPRWAALRELGAGG
jgi:uncharacterized protein